MSGPTAPTSRSKAPLPTGEWYDATKTKPPTDAEFVFPTTYKKYANLSDATDERRELAGHLQYVYEDLRNQGALNTAYRLAQLDEQLARKSYDPAEVLFRVNLDEARSEIDDVAGKWARRWTGLRNLFSLLPLLLTWLALGIAGTEYWYYYQHARQVQLQTHGTNFVESFLVAWEGGFGKSSGVEYLFSTVAFTDFVLLTLVFFLTWFTHWAEGRALRKASLSYQKVTRVVGEFMDALRVTQAKEGGQDPQQWRDAIISAIDGVNVTVTGVSTTVNEAMKVIAEVRASTTSLFQGIDERISQVVTRTGDHLGGTVNDLGKQMSKYTDQTNRLLESVDKVKSASEALQANVGQYTVIANTIDGHIAGLQTTQGQLVGQMTTAAGAITTVAGALSAERFATLADEVHTSTEHLRTSFQAQQQTPEELLEAVRALKKVADEIANRMQPQRGGWGDPRPRQGTGRPMPNVPMPGSNRPLGNAGLGGLGGVPMDETAPQPAANFNQNQGQGAPPYQQGGQPQGEQRGWTQEEYDRWYQEEQYRRGQAQGAYYAEEPEREGPSLLDGVRGFFRALDPFNAGKAAAARRRAQSAPQAPQNPPTNPPTNPLQNPPQDQQPQQ